MKDKIEKEIIISSEDFDKLEEIRNKVFTGEGYHVYERSFYQYDTSYQDYRIVGKDKIESYIIEKLEKEINSLKIENEGLKKTNNSKKRIIFYVVSIITFIVGLGMIIGSL